MTKSGTHLTELVDLLLQLKVAEGSAVIVARGGQVIQVL